jgi:transmembrane sensor
MGNERAEELIRKYLAGNATPEEEALLESWYIAAAQEQPDMTGEPANPNIEAEMLESLRAEQQELPKIGEPKSKSPVRLWPRVAAAAAVILILSVGSFFLSRKSPTQAIVQQQPLENDILPAGARATLTLLDGRTIPLDSADSHALARQGNATISSLGGQLIYGASQPGRSTASQPGGNSTNQPGGPAAQGNLAYNTLTTRPGEHYSLLLPDGTKAWLNAGSSITYPVVFEGNERKVKVTGEVYFEVVHDAKQPFKIAVKDQLVEDIGTHLNINAYDDESTINTTLLEGSIKVTKGSASAILAPGQQAKIRPVGNSFQIQKVDADEAIAWKNGYFYFDRADIQTMMRQLARWYDVQVIYKGEISKRTFKGKLYRNIKASEALRILTYFGAHFQIDGKTITVTF